MSLLMPKTSGRFCPLGGAARTQTRSLPAALALCAAVLALSGSVPAVAGSGAEGGEGPIEPAANRERAVDLTGVTLDALGRTLPAVRVLVRPVGGEDAAQREPRSVFSDERGRFSLPRLAPGAYHLVALKGGYSVFIARVDTAMKRTLELVLQPAGDPGQPGERPEDGSWALRLPARDRLEATDLSVGLDAAAEPASGHGGNVTLAASRIAWSEAASESMHASYMQTFDLGGAGDLRAALRHRSGAATEQEREEFDAVRARWQPPEGAHALWPELELSGSRWLRALPVDGAVDGGPVEQADSARVRSIWRPGSGMFDTVTFTAAGSWGRRSSTDAAPQPGPNRDWSAARMSVSTNGEHSWEGAGGVHRTRYHAQGTVASGIKDETGGGERVALGLSSGAPALEAVGRSHVDVQVVDRLLRSARLQLITRARAGWIDQTSGLGAGAASAGARWKLLDGLFVDAEAAVSGRDRRGGDAAWTLGMSGRADRWRWSVSRHAGDAYAPWLATGPGARGGGLPSFFAAGLGADVDAWLTEIGWRGPGGWPSFELHASRQRARGALAIRLPEDVAAVPVAADAAADARHVRLIVALDRTGTRVALLSTEVEDGSVERRLLEGAEVWRRQAVQLRQRLGSDGFEGMTWHVALAFERTDVRGPVPAPEDPLRLAALDRSRFLGGLSLAF